MRKHLFTIIKIAISGFIMYVLFSNMDMVKFKDTIFSINPIALVAAVVLLLCVQVVSTLRWSIILSKDAKVPFRTLISIYLIGMFFNNFLPTIVGGDVLKGYYLYKASGKGGLAAASVFLDRYAGVSALMTIALIAIILGHSLLEGTRVVEFLLIIIASYVCASLILWVDLFHSWFMKIMAKIHFYGINQKIEALYQVLMSYKGERSIISRAFVCSLFIQSTVMFIYFLFGWGLGIDISIGYYFIFVPIATVVSMLPISLAGLGVREGVFVYLFSTAGVPKEQAIGVSLLFFFITVLVSLAGGVLYVKMGGKKGAEEAGGAAAKG